MKGRSLTYLFITFLINSQAGSVLGQGQQDSVSLSVDTIFLDPEIHAVFPEGELALMKFIFERIQYPSTCKTVSGIVYLSVKISKDGIMSDPELKRGLDPYFDKEALRVVSLLPREWTPARVGNKPVDSEYVIPIKFVLH